MATEAEEVGAKIEEIVSDIKQALLMKEKLLTRQQAGEMLSCSPEYVDKLVALRELERFDIARDAERPMWRIRQSDVAAFIARVTEDE
jgi:hypothetical protein